MEAKTIRTSTFAKEFDFNDIRPFYDSEAREVLFKLIKDPIFFKLINYLWPEMTMEDVEDKANLVFSNLDFQHQFMHKGIRTILEKSATELTTNGFDHLDKNEAYLYIANHRDILLDSAILQILLVENNISTSEITFGNNLMDEGFITLFGKLNRMFTVLRDGTSKELYEISRKLSAYIRHTLVDKNTSVWIAQRNGRTKDGIDATQTGLLKMLNISGEGDFIQNFSQLKIVPLTISYEYEPCDSLKAEENYLSSLHTKYQKAKGEDLNSILTGIQQQKGRIHLEIGKPVISELGQCESCNNDNDRIKKLAQLIDLQIYKDYKLWPVNYIASDMLNQSYKYEGRYSEAEKEAFQNYVAKSIKNLKGDQESLTQNFLKIYANPVMAKNQ